MNKNNNSPKNIAQYIFAIMTRKTTDRNSEFEEWMTKNRYSYEVSTRMCEEKTLSKAVDNYNSIDGAKHIDNMRSKLRKMKRRKLAIRISSASAALIAITLLLFDFSENQTTEIVSPKNSELISSAASNEVRLISEDGSSVSLEQITDCTYAQNNIVITKSEEATISLSSEKTATAEVMRFVVPHKKTYSVILPDSTKVMLNANSEIEFLSRFDGERREVRLTGEAYFEVKSNKKQPFVVHSNGVDIVVRGTKFNVNSYDSESVSTLLVEGIVAVSMAGTKDVVLKPNQLSITNIKSKTNDILDIKNIDEKLSWLKNSFVFSGQTINEAIQIIKRWYGVAIEISGSSDVKITAEFTKDIELSEILNILESLSGTKLKITADEIK